MIDIEKGCKNFDNYMIQAKEFEEKKLNESDTRSKLIDKLFIEVLGWSEEDIFREKKVDSGYYDYKIAVPGFQFLIEAKRQFIKFNLPTGQNTIKLSLLLNKNEPTINQVRNYAIDEGVPNIVITNGQQFIIAKIFNYNGTSWKNNKALVYKSLEEIKDDFINFYNNLSKKSIIKNGSFEFDIPEKQIEGNSILTSLLDKDKELVRNNLTGVLAPLLNTVFGEMFREDETEENTAFIKECFVENDETIKNKDEIERLFSDIAPHVKNIIPIVNSENLANSIYNEIENEEIKIINPPPNPTIIIGSKGAGKTTFINHLFKYKFDTKEFENHYIIYLDFRTFYEDKSNFEYNKIAEKILDEIYEKYEDLQLNSKKTLIRIYRKQIKENDSGIWEWDKQHSEEKYQERLSNSLQEWKKDNLNHLNRLSHYLIKERRKRLVIIIDNVDQFNDKIQEALFIFSQSLTKSSLCGTVISLREGYYKKWQNSPPFDAYESNVYHITAPPYIEVLSKRLDYAIKKISEENKIYKINVKTKKIPITPEYLKNFILGVKNSLIIQTNSALLEFINLTTFPNIREGLHVFKVFLNSGHTKAIEYIDREQRRIIEQRSYQTIPLHEFIKSVALQNRHYYCSQYSIIINLFNPPNDTEDHFIKLYILIYLSRQVELNPHSDKFINLKSLIEHFAELGYRIQIILEIIKELIKQSLIDTNNQFSDIIWDKISENDQIQLTAKGYYYLKKLVNRFLYIDLISQDTRIFNENYYQNLIQIFPKSNENGIRSLELRKEYAKTFIEYLQFQNKLQANQLQIKYGHTINSIFQQIITEIENIN